MRGQFWAIAAYFAVFVGTVAPAARAYTPPPQDAPAERAPDGNRTVEDVSGRRGMLFYPSAPEAGTFRFSFGALYDAIDPQVMYGMNLRVPQLTLDAQDWLGKGFLFKAHLNTFLVTTELLAGVGYVWQAKPFSVELSATVGAYVGKLGAFGFHALFLAPEYRPELTLGYDFGKIAVSVRGSLLLMGPERAKVGSTWGGFDNASLFAGHSEMLYVENTTRKGSVWYFGAGAMTTRAYYALWLLFPDSPALYTYPRIVAGYEY
jgi:hypothetical protein